MKIVNFSEQNSIVNQYLAEIRDVDYQKNRLLFRNNIQRIGELEAYEISKTLDYEARDITTPLGVSRMQVPTDKIVLATLRHRRANPRRPQRRQTACVRPAFRLHRLDRLRLGSHRL